MTANLLTLNASKTEFLLVDLKIASIIGFIASINATSLFTPNLSTVTHYTTLS